MPVGGTKERLHGEIGKRATFKMWCPKGFECSSHSGDTYGDMMKLVDMQDLKSCGTKVPCWFESDYRYK